MLMQAAFRRAHVLSPLQTVHDGEEAIAYLKGEGPYADRTQYPLPVVVLLDLNIPKVNGFNVLAFVRSQPGLKRIPIIILTSSSRNEDVERAYDMGANAFLVKPAALSELIAMTLRLRDWLEMNHFPAT